MHNHQTFQSHDLQAHSSSSRCTATLNPSLKCIAWQMKFAQHLAKNEKTSQHVFYYSFHSSGGISIFWMNTDKPYLQPSAPTICISFNNKVHPKTDVTRSSNSFTISTSLDNFSLLISTRPFSKLDIWPSKYSYSGVRFRPGNLPPNQTCAPLPIALSPALLAGSAFQPCRNAIFLLLVSLGPSCCL